MHSLESLGDERAVPALKRVVDTVVEPRTSRAARVAIKTLREGKSPHENVEKLRSDFDRLRQQYSELLSRMESLEQERSLQKT